LIATIERLSATMLTMTALHQCQKISPSMASASNRFQDPYPRSVAKDHPISEAAIDDAAPNHKQANGICVPRAGHFQPTTTNPAPNKNRAMGKWTVAGCKKPCAAYSLANKLDRAEVSIVKGIARTSDVFRNTNPSVAIRVTRCKEKLGIMV
jgi:hypothetical protein